MRRWSGFLLLVAAAALVTLVVAGSQTEEAQEEGEPAPAKIKIPDEERGRENPVSATPESIKNGKMLFSSQCTMCHGDLGAGDGSLVERLNLTMPNFTDAAKLGQRTDGELFYILTEGCRRMPGQERRFKDEIKWDLVNYIRTLPQGS